MTTSEYRGTPYELLSLLRDHSSTDIPAAFAAMIDALRDLQEKAAGSRPPEEVAGRVATVLASLAEALGEFTVEEAHQLSGRLGSLPGRRQIVAFNGGDQLAGAHVVAFIDGKGLDPARDTRADDHLVGVYRADELQIG